MKTIYLCENEPNIRRVFCTDAPVYSKRDVLANPEKFRDTAYFFSTWGIPIFTEEEIKAYFPNLKAVFYGAGSVQHFARPFLNCGVKVFSAWAANAVPVAEYTVAQIILANKGFYACCRSSNRDKRIANRQYSAAFPGNYGVKVGIIGAGTIGKMVIRRLNDYCLQVLVFDPFLPDETANALGVTKCSLEQLFAECSVVSNHLADNEQTKGILNGKLFETMIPYATFLNTGRGAQVVEDELIAVLKARPDLTAVLDVTDPEPPVAESEFYSLPNCVLTPHIAGSNGNEVRRLGDCAQAEYQAFTTGKPCRYEVTLEMLQKMA